MLNEKALSDGFAALNDLANAEYHRPLQDLDNDVQIARLIGVALKQPFGRPVRLEKPSYTGAYRAWELVDEDMFNEPARQASWQYQVLEQLAKTEGRGWDAYDLALDAHHERGFFGYLARSTAKYVCGDPKIRREIKKAADDVRKSGIGLTIASPDAVVGSAGLSLGILLVQHVPILGFVGPPVIAGFILILYRIGIDAFCEWTQQEYRVSTPIERQ